MKDIAIERRDWVQHSSETEWKNAIENKVWDLVASGDETLNVISSSESRISVITHTPLRWKFSTIPNYEGKITSLN